MKEVLREIAERYGFETMRFDLIRHNENKTYCVGGKYLLRIHRSKEGFTSGLLYNDVDRIAIRREEIRFLKHLKDCRCRFRLKIAAENVSLFFRTARQLQFSPGFREER